MATTKNVMELDPRVQAIIDEEFAEFDTYLPSPQDKKLYERKRKEYWENVSARLKEGAITDGRANDNAADTGSK